MGDVAAEPAADAAAMVELTLSVDSDTLVMPEDAAVLGGLLLLNDGVAFMVGFALDKLVKLVLDAELEGGAELEADVETDVRAESISVDMLDTEVLETTSELLWLAKELEG